MITTNGSLFAILPQRLSLFSAVFFPFFLEDASHTPRSRHTHTRSHAQHWPSCVLRRNAPWCRSSSASQRAEPSPSTLNPSPVIGAGTYANNASCAVSATGHGEFFIRATVARDICSRMEYAGANLAEASDTVINQVLVEMGGAGGIIAVDHAGNVALEFNTAGMYRASVDTNGNVFVGIYDDEE